ncbi:MAG TPA: metalloregulator ArsR/SmtB family transcription factor [Chthoniobacteraceae bacterium]|nr:metalloregulator ArsR/SmtB family transcription factor [Chthoniobacteraceae bacterium]
MRSDECLPALRALADPSRMKILELLMAGDHNVNQLAEHLGTPQYNISKHLRILREAGIIVSKRVGKEIHCEVATAFRVKARAGGWTVDLGCCAFRFDPPEK